MIETDFLIVGAGIIGITIARELKERYNGIKIIVTEKEKEPACHTSGRNSGVLHAGFYYTSDSLKAKFTAHGNKLLTDYCLLNNISINRCGKVVVAKNEEELKGLFELKRRGDNNNVHLKLIDEKELRELEPNAKTFEKALYSPNTSVVNPKEVCLHLAESIKNNVNFYYNNPLFKINKNIAITKKEKIKFNHLINCAGLYADKISHECGVGLNYTMLPFKGLYLKYNESNVLKMHIYPVPDLQYPFLGVHFTKTVDGKVKIGPTSVPTFWRENYNGFENFKISELAEILYYESKLFFTNKFNFRNLALSEMKKSYQRKSFIKQASCLVKEIDANKFGGYSLPGIRAQLFDKKSSKLVMDFIIESGEISTHILNAISPAFTCSFVFAKYVVDKIKWRAN